MSRARGLALIAAAAFATAAAGCASKSPGDLTPAAAKVLQPQVQHIRDVAKTGDYLALQAAVAELRALVEREQRDGQVSPSRAAAIEDAADALLQDASPAPTTPPPTTTTPPPTTTTPPPTTTTPPPTTTTPPPTTSTAAIGVTVSPSPP